MKLSELILSLQERLDTYRFKYGTEPIIFASAGDLYLCARIEERGTSTLIYHKPYLKIPRKISRALEVKG